MNTKIVSVIALALTTTTGMATAQDANEPESTQAEVASSQIEESAALSKRERLNNYLSGTFGSKAVARTAFGAELRQLREAPKEWGSGSQGMATRFASGFGQHLIRKTLEYPLSSILHENNRYVRSGRKGFFKRTRYAIAGTFLARHDNGRRGFSFSRVGSAGGASFISRAWMPQSAATMGAGASSFGISIGVDIGSNVVREFWPELKHHFRRHSS